MLVVLNARLARRVAAVTSTASPDEERPVLTGIHLEWTAKGSGGEPSVTFVTTDSYKLIAYEVDSRARDNDEPRRFGAAQVDGDGSTLIPARAFARAMEKAAKHATVKDPNGLVVLTAEPEGPVLVLASHPDKGEEEIAKIEPIDGAFPKWRSLVPRWEGGTGSHSEYTVDSVIDRIADVLDDVEVDEARTVATRIVNQLDKAEYRFFKGDPTRVGLNPAYLDSLFAAFNAGRAAKFEDVPVVLHVSGSTLPVIVRSNGTDDTWMAALMPVRL